MIGVIQTLIGRHGVKKAVNTNASTFASGENIEAPINYNENSGYYSQKCSEPGEWWQVNILLGHVYIDSYRLKTYHMPENHAHLKSWILEGSSDYGKNFAPIDEVSDNNDINGNYKEKIFTLSKKVGPFNSFRLNTRNTHHDGYNYCMRLNEFDVYGSFLYARFSPKAKKKYLPKIFILLVMAIHIS